MFQTSCPQPVSFDRSPPFCERELPPDLLPWFSGLLRISFICLVCVRVYPFGAPFINADHVSEIPPSACQGWGICVCECPAQAIALRHTRDEQLNAAIDGLLEQAL